MKKEKSLIIYYIGIITGIIMVLIGIAGLFLPILPGIILIIIGIALITGTSIAGLIKKFRKKTKQITQQIQP